MKWIKCLFVLALILGLNQSASALVWRQRDGALVRIPNRSLQNWLLNGRTVRFSNEIFSGSWRELRNHYPLLFKQVGPYAIGCKTAMPPLVSTLDALKGQCIFARKTKGHIYSYKVALNGLPLPKRPQTVDWGGHRLSLHKGDRVWDLAADPKRHFHLLAIRKTQSDIDYLPSIRKKWLSSGWQEIRLKEKGFLTAVKSNQMMTARESPTWFLAVINES